jgi:hypothetical protein
MIVRVRETTRVDDECHCVQGQRTESSPCGCFLHTSESNLFNCTLGSLVLAIITNYLILAFSARSAMQRIKGPRIYPAAVGALCFVAYMASNSEQMSHFAFTHGT